jgi:hypothetical protein
MTYLAAAQAKRATIAAQETTIRNALSAITTALSTIGTNLSTIETALAARVDNCHGILEDRFRSDTATIVKEHGALVPAARLEDGALIEALVRAIVAAGIGRRTLRLDGFVSVRDPAPGPVSTVDAAFTAVNNRLLAQLDSHIIKITD